MSFQDIGFIGGLIFLYSYVPQLTHLLKQKNSIGISVSSWVMGAIGLIILFAYSVYRKDLVFMILIFLELIITIVTLILTVKFKPKKK
jgi:lipid-A-disaccharide synthase-like uncharacterized protein